MAEGHFGDLKCAYGSHDKFLVLLISRVLIIRSDESRVSMLFGHTLAPLVFGRHHHYDRKFPFFFLINNFPEWPIFSSRIPIIKRQCFIRKFSSAKNFVNSDRQAVRHEYIFVKRRSSLVCSSLIHLSLFCLLSIFAFMNISDPKLAVCEII